MNTNTVEIEYANAGAAREKTGRAEKRAMAKTTAQAVAAEMRFAMADGLACYRQAGAYVRLGGELAAAVGRGKGGKRLAESLRKAAAALPATASAAQAALLDGAAAAESGNVPSAACRAAVEAVRVALDTAARAAHDAAAAKAAEREAAARDAASKKQGGKVAALEAEIARLKAALDAAQGK